MRRALKFAAASLCLIGLIHADAWAADDAELERIRQAVAEAIEPSPDATGPTVALAAPVGAAWRDGWAVISLKGAKLIDPEGSSLVVGDVEIAVLPRGDGFYDFEVTMPKGFDAFTAEGLPEGKLTIGSYKLAGTWAREVGSLSNLDASFSGLEATDLQPGEDDFNAKLASLEARLNYTKGSGGLWSGTGNARLADLRIVAEGGSDDVAIAAIEIKSATTGWDWATWQRAMNKLEALAEPGATTPSEEERRALAQEIRTINWGVNDATLTINGLSVASERKPVFTLGSSTWKLGLDGSKEAGPLSFRIAVGDLSVAENTLPTNLAPTKGALDITFDQFPVRAFFGSMLEQALDEMMAPPPGSSVPVDGAGVPPADVPAETPVEGASPAGDMAMTEAAPSEDEAEAMPPEGGPESEMEPPPSETQEPPMMGPFPADDLFLQQLFALGTVFALNEFSVDAPGTGVNASGRVKVDPEAMGMGTGKLKATIRGIDAVLAYVNAETKTDEEMKDVGAFLIFLKGLGRAESGAGGETAYVYDIDVPKGGAPTVNGTPIDGLMGE